MFLGLFLGRLSFFGANFLCDVNIYASKHTPKKSAVFVDFCLKAVGAQAALPGGWASGGAGGRRLIFLTEYVTTKPHAKNQLIWIKNGREMAVFSSVHFYPVILGLAS